ncbi:class I SAM-dependent methyltransferase [Niabella ginsengisoli]|uniref:Protein N-lysine methyltransferase family protein n=1 Tax=Niabella ginsengisoli TaxID=522298 RepID=A0ABS9SEF5_9BACT|nr:protein N-lysine methyltransferase family protein [Niabella ginsengisoli]MCH5596706.1 protein N-lysine methyltransferase family protein [Niabella ginsengisoli]
MTFPLILQSYSIDDVEQEIYIPDQSYIQQFYKDNTNAAYWARIWPASVGLCKFLKQNLKYIAGKKILELAAGLGLPGIYSAPYAETVTITDKEPLAEDIVRKSAAYLKLTNVQAKTLNWKDISPEQPLDVLLLSDVNYEPAVFKELEDVLINYLKNKITVIISTPQRLVARQFINSLLPYCIKQWNCSIILENSETGVSVFVLQNG